MTFRFEEREIPGVYTVYPKIIPDVRGISMEAFKISDLQSLGIKKFVQTNYTRSFKNVLRGLHYQKNPFAQGKLISVLAGEVFDVAVDLRKDSPTFGKSIHQSLSSQNSEMLYIPEGFAHGFYVLSASETMIVSPDSRYWPPVTINLSPGAKPSRT